jgi:hypothetical protein
MAKDMTSGSPVKHILGFAVPVFLGSIFQQFYNIVDYGAVAGVPELQTAKIQAAIDAAFLALEQIMGTHFELDDFQIQSVTQGKEAMGSALVKLRKEGKLYSGNGISTDIISASIKAYINAVNKIVYEGA